MAIDPSISLGYRPPVIAPLQLADPLEQFAKVQTLRNLMQEQQSGQLGLQAQQLKMQEAQRALQDEEKLRANPTMSDAELIGAFGSRAMPLIKARGEQTQQFYKTEGERYGLLGQLAGSATDKDSATRAIGLAIRSRAFDPDPAKNAEIGQQMLDHLNTNGYNPAEYKQFQFIAMKGKEAHDAMAADTKATLEEAGVQAENVRKAAEAEQKQRQLEASTLGPAIERGAVAFQQALAKMDPKRAALYSGFRNWRELMMFANTPHEQITAQQAAANAARQSIPNTPTELAIWMNDPKRTPEERASGQAAMKELERHAVASRPVINNMIPGLPPVGGGGNQTTGEEFLKTLPPGVAADIRGMAEGRLTAPTANSRAPGAAQRRDALLRYDPGFSEQRAQIRKSFTTGPDGRNIGALNTAIVHLGRLGNTAESLENGSFVPGNEAYNWLRDKFGSDKVTNFGLLKDAVAGEMAAALKGNATDIEIEKMGKSIRAANSPAQMRGVIQEGMAILNDKANTYNERYHREMPDDPWSPILPSAREQLARHSHGGGTTTYKAGDTRVINGKTYTRDASGNWK